MICAKTKLVRLNFRDTEIAVFDKSLPLLDLYKFAQEVSNNSGRKCGPIKPILAEQLLSSSVNSTIVQASPFATSGLIAYEKEGARLSSEIVCEDHNGTRVILPTYDLKGEKTIALFVEKISISDFSDNQKNEITATIESNRIIPIPAFPDQSGCYETYQRTTIPHGAPLENGHGRFLSRTKQPYVGPISRGYSFDGHGMEYILVDYSPSYRLGSVFEVEPVKV